MKKSKLLVYTMCISLLFSVLPNKVVNAEEILGGAENNVQEELNEDETTGGVVPETTSEETTEAVAVDQSAEEVTTEATTEAPALPMLSSEEKAVSTSNDVASPTDATLTDALTSETKEVKAGETESIVINSNAELTAFLNRDDTEWNYGCYVGSKGKVEIELHGTLTLPQNVNITVNASDPAITKDADIVVSGDATIYPSSSYYNITIGDSPSAANREAGSALVQGLTSEAFISLCSPTSTAQNITINGNSADINLGGSTLNTMSNCTINSGGQIGMSKNPLLVDGCTFNNGSSLYFDKGFNGTIKNCIFNADEYYHGGLYFCDTRGNGCSGTVSNCTFNSGIETGVYYYGNQKLTVDGCTFSSDTGVYLYKAGVTCDNQVVVSNSTFTCSEEAVYINEVPTTVTGCTITGTDNTDNSCIGIYVKGGTGSDFGTTSTEASKIAAVTSGDYTGHIAIVGTTIKDCYTGIKAHSSISCIVSGCTITNVNSGFDGASAGNTNTLIYNTSFKAKNSPDTDSIGTGRFNAGPGIIDCDFEGFNVGVDKSSGGWVVKGCKFKNCISKGIVSYMTYINDCTFEGGTTIFIDKGTAQDCIRGITMVGNNTNTGLASGPSRYIGGLGASNECGGDNGYFGYMSNHPYLALSQRNLTQGKVDISNLKRGIDASGTLAAGNVNISDVNIHDCEAGIYSESQVYVYGDSTFKNCDTGIEAGWIQFGTTQNTADKMLLFDTCDYGLKLDLNNSMTAQTGYPAKYKVKATNCGYGIYAEQSSNGNWTATNTPIELTNNTVGLYFKNYQFVSQQAPITCSGNGTSAIIDWPYGQRIYDNFQSTDSTLDVKLKGTMNFHVNGAGVPSADQGGRYTGNLKVYLDTPESMIQIDRPHDNASTIEFDMPDGDYVNGRVVAASVSNDFTYANAYTAKKDGWIVTFIPRDLYPSGLTYGQSAFVLSEGCRVTYDYATNGGTSMDKNASGSADFMNGEDVFNQLLNAGKIDTTDPSYDEATVKQQYIDRYAACAVTTPLNKYNYRKNAQIDLTPKGVKVDSNGDVWECVGWNTNPDATTGLTSLTAGSTNITLYAIYRKKVTVNYKTYDPASDYSQDVYLYNKQTSPSGYKYLAYAGGNAYKFEGYALDKTSLSNLKKANDSITNAVDVYCVYTKGGKITYLDADGTVIKSETKDVKAAATDIVAPKYSYTVMAYPGKEGKVFNCWRGNNDSYKGGETITTGLAEITLKADVSDAPITRTVTVKGCLKYKDGTPIANKVIKLYEDTEITVPQVNNSISAPTVLAQVAAGTAAHEYQTTTDENGQYVFKDVKVGKYDLSLWDGESKLGECFVTIADKASKKDAVAVTDARDDVDIEYAISGDIIDISALLAIDPPKDATVTPAKSENNGVKTGDATPILPVVFVLLGSMAGIAVINLARRRKREE